MKIFIAIPCMEDLPVDFVKSLTRLQTLGQTTINYSVGSLVYASRQFLAETAVKEGADYILWLDSDMTFDSDLLIDLMKDVQEGRDFVSGLYFRRKPPYTPVLYKKIRMGMFANEGITIEYDDYPENEIFEIDACGFGGVLMRTEMVKAIIEKEGHTFSPLLGYGEDISFCIRAKRLGYQLWCDSRIKMGHIAKTVANEETFKAYNARKE